ncbi:MAG: hypothetical protein PVG14_11310 [Anaerolineales bacterium]
MLSLSITTSIHLFWGQVSAGRHHRHTFRAGTSLDQRTAVKPPDNHAYDYSGIADDDYLD